MRIVYVLCPWLPPHIVVLAVPALLTITPILLRAILR